MSKIAFFYSFNPSSWISCQKIVFNLLKSYQSINHLDCKYYHFNEDTSYSTLTKHVTELKNWKAEKIIILDHKPHPLPIFSLLHQEYMLESTKPDLFVHIYGDFSINYKWWSQCRFLESWKVRWFCASERQANYFKQLVNDKNSVSLCPFPIDPSRYFYDKSIRLKQRQDWNLKPHEKVMIYTGRLSMQKRIHTLIKYFAKTKMKNPEYRLHLYGEFDNISDPFFGIWHPEGKYFSDIMRIVRSLPEEVQKDIYWFGGVSNDDLPRAYHGADLLVSFSVHHDEDYGMTVAEAMSCGLPCLLSDWAGYGSFKLAGIENWIRLVKIKLKPNGRLMSKLELNRFSDELLPQLDHAPRERISQKGLEYFSITQSAKRIKEQLDSPQSLFKGFSPLFDKLVSAHQNYGLPFTQPHQMRFNKLYKETYGPYVRAN
ncbi:MAG: glycosyltransferase family 4 protein [Bacteriovoracaceae bacterium]